MSIIVVAFDVRDEVLACMESIECHSGTLKVEAILVDNASRDGTAEAVATRFPEVRVVRRATNAGVAARSDGLALARGRYRMFLDSDARLTTGALEELVEFMDRSDDIGLVGPRLVYADNSLQLSARRYPPLLLPLMRRAPLQRWLERSPPVRRHLMADGDHARTREVEYVLGAAQLFSAQAQHAAGDFTPMFYGPDDADWCFRIRRAGYRVFYHPAATVIHDYRRATARRPVSGQALRHLLSFYGFQWRWRRERRRLIAEGHQMDAAAAGAEGGERHAG